MIYNEKNIFEDSPASADNYRKDYTKGIENYIERIKSESKNIRQSFMLPDELVKNPDKFRKIYREMLGIDMFDAYAPKTEKVYVGTDDICSIYRLKTYIAPEIPFYSMLLIPHETKSPMPLVIAQHGGGGTPELCCDFVGKNNYNHMAQRALKRGAAILAPQLLLWTKEESETMRAHPIEYERYSIDHNLKHFGASITALEISGISKSLDYACSLDEIDSERIAMIGLSYGGYFTLHTMAADTRIKAGYAAGSFNDRNVYDWQDWCYFGSGIKFHDAEVAALCAPRKLYIQVGKQDAVFNYQSAISEAERAADYFKAMNCEKNFVFSLWDGGHTVSGDDEGYDFIFSELK